MDFTAHYDSPLGGITMASDGTSLIGLWFDGQKYFGYVLDTHHKVQSDLPVFVQTKHWLDVYFSGKDPGFTPPLVMRANDFRRAVWKQLLAIPYGCKSSYGEIARRIAAERGLISMSAQAVGNAVGHNSISLIIPCHRVVGADGKLTGYAAGVDKKMWLLKLEGSM